MFGPVPPTTPIVMPVEQLTRRHPVLQIIDTAAVRIDRALSRNMPFDARMAAARYWFRQAAVDAAREIRNSQHPARSHITIDVHRRAGGR